MLLKPQEVATGYMQTEDIPSDHVNAAFSALTENQISPGERNLSQEQSPSPSLCSGCGYYIFDPSYLLMAGKAWHTDCLKCSMCACTLNSANSCFMKDGKILCKEDYYSSKAQTSRACAGCGCWIGAEDLVMRARGLVYHVACFTCITCRRMLVPGERFSIDEDTGRLHCCNCWKHTDYYNNTNVLTSQFPPFYEDDAMGKPGKRKSESSLSMEQTNGLPYGLDYSDQDGSGTYPPQKTKRMRTSFKHHQLRAMKSYFNMNHNPDAKDLKQLAQETGLTKRVLQVWFQNARAKYRRGKGSKDIRGKKSDEREKCGDHPEGDHAEDHSKDIEKEIHSNGDESGGCDLASNSENDEVWQAGHSTSGIGSSSNDIHNFSSGDSSLSPRSDTIDNSALTPWKFDGSESNNLSYPSHASTTPSVPAAPTINGDNAVYGYTQLQPPLRPSVLQYASESPYGDNKPTQDINSHNSPYFASTDMYEKQQAEGYCTNSSLLLLGSLYSEGQF